MRTLIVVAVIVVTGTGACLAQQGSPINHNGSKMLVVVENGNFAIYYDRPKQGLANIGIAKGTLLFSGRQSEQGVKGTAFAFRKGCPPTPYNVSGITGDGTGFELSGPGPVNGAGCQVHGYSWKSIHSRLVFTTSFEDD